MRTGAKRSLGFDVEASLRRLDGRLKKQRRANARSAGEMPTSPSPRLCATMPPWSCSPEPDAANSRPCDWRIEDWEARLRRPRSLSPEFMQTSGHGRDRLCFGIELPALPVSGPSPPSPSGMFSRALQLALSPPPFKLPPHPGRGDGA